jgi:tripartite-type tricarboxylate transporter receptor subunit TctC
MFEEKDMIHRTDRTGSWRRTLTGFAVAALVPAMSALAQTGTNAAAGFPSHTVTLVAPFTPSSGSDIIARILAPKLSSRWGVPVIVENRPGASGNLGAQVVASSPPDGHTLLMAINSFTMTPAIYRNMPYDAASDFAPIAKLAEAGYAFALHPAVQASDVASLLALVRRSPGSMHYGTPGNGTPHHLAVELLKSTLSLDIVHVPYKGIQGALTDLMSGQVDMMFATVHSIRPLAQAGKLRLIAVTGAVRNPVAPDIPTFKEQGIDVMDSVDAWYGVLAAARTAPERVAKLNRDFIETVNLEDVRTALQRQGLAIRTTTPAQFTTIIASDLARWKKVVADARITAD